MRAVDTNILVRWITRDDPSQTAAADAVMETPVLVPVTVLIELAWTLQGKTYRMTRSELAMVFERMLNVPTISIAAEDGVRWAIERFAAGADFADMIHLILSDGATAFVSFEKRLASCAGPDTPVPVQRPI